MEKIIMTPFMVEVLLHYHWSSNDYPDIHSEGFKEAMRIFIEAGIFYERVADIGNRYGYSQSALDVYVNAILEIPLPTQVWIIKS